MQSVLLVIDLVPLERKRKVNPLTGEDVATHEQISRVNPKGGNKEESPRQNIRKNEIPNAIRDSAKRK